MWLNLPELLLRMESVGRWRGRANLRWGCRTSSDCCPESLIRNVIWLKWFEIACICSKCIYILKWSDIIVHYKCDYLKYFITWRRIREKTRNELGWGVGEGETRRGKVQIKCDLDLYVRTLSRSSPIESSVRLPGQEHKTPTDKVEEKEFTELCKVLVSIFQWLCE